MTTSIEHRGANWFDALTKEATVRNGQTASVKVADGQLDGRAARFLAVVPNANNPYPRAAGGQVGLLEGWTLAEVIQEAITADADKAEKRAIVAIIDVPSQAYGRREEGFAIHQALAGAAGAYAQARLAGHPVIGLIVGKAMSGAFLAHGYQANRLIAFNDDGVQVHAMGKASAARITLRTVESLEKLAATIPPMAYDIANYSTLGLLHELLDIEQPDAPQATTIAQVQAALSRALADIKDVETELTDRFGAENRASSSRVRELMRAQW